MPAPTRAAMSEAPRPRWPQRLARFAFWFFLLKGLLWLVVPLAAAWWGWQLAGG